jgi:integrase
VESETISSRDQLKSNALRVLEKTDYRIGLQDVFLVFRTLGLKTPNIFNLDVALKTLWKLLSLSNSDSLEDLRISVANFYQLEQVKPFIETFPKGGKVHDSNFFLIDNEKFKQNPQYGLFAALDPEVQDSLTLAIDEQNPTYHPLLTYGLFAVLLTNKSYPVEEPDAPNNSSNPHRGIKTLCTNLKLLATSPEWKKQFAGILSDFAPRCNAAQHKCNLNHFFKALQKQELNTSVLTKDQSDLLNKLKNMHKFVEECLSDGDPSKFDLTPEIPPADDEKQRPSIEIFRKPSLPEESDEELELRSNLFLNTIGTHRSEAEAQNLLHSNQTLLPHEIRIVEDSIFESSAHLDKETDIKVKLCRALMLYYSVPIERIPQVLLGVPGLDIAKPQMVHRIVIDLENDLIYLSTPIQKLHEDSEEQFKHNHLPLPLEVKIKALLMSLIVPNSSSDSLSTLIDSEVLKQARSFKQLAGFRQFRITDGKVARVLSTNVLSQCHDEVKTAYLQGGAYNFIHMGCYYTQLSMKDLTSLYVKTCKEIFSRHKLPEISEPHGMVGSLRCPEIKTVTRFLKAKSEKLDRIKKQIKANQDFWEYHNELTLYTVTLLNLSSTHRPHQDPYYSIHNFLDFNLVQITEKEIMKGYEGRLSVLSDVSTDQFQAYLKHLQFLKSTFSQLGSVETAKVLEDVLTGRLSPPTEALPLFFLVEDQKLKHVSKRILRDYYMSELGIELSDNFYRHLLSSSMSSLDCPRILTANQMGHLSKGLEAFSNNNRLSPRELSQQIMPYLEQYFKLLDLSIVEPLNYAKYASLPMMDFDWSLTVLGPYKREKDREVVLHENVIKHIDDMLSQMGVSVYKSKLYINQELQRKHLKQLKELGFKGPKKILARYYRDKVSTLRWRIENTRQLNKSYFDKFFGRKFHLGKQYSDQIFDLILNAINKDVSQQVETLQILLSLSSLISGAVFNRHHLLEIANSQESCFEDIKLSKAIDLRGGEQQSHRTWILNSISVALLDRLSDCHRETISAQNIDAFLKEHHLPKLTNLISNVRAYLRVSIPSCYINIADSISLQSSIGVAGYQVLMGHYFNDAKLNKQLDFEDPFEFVPVDTEAESVHSDKMIVLDKVLREARNDGKGHGEALDMVVLEIQKAEGSLTLAEFLLINWVETALREKWHAVSSLSTYFQDVYKYIVNRFIFESIDFIDEEDLVEEFYPSILRTMQDHYGNKISDIPTSALASFHHSLAIRFGFEGLHFSGTKVESKASIQTIISEPEFQACLSAIKNTPNCDEQTKTGLLIALIFYRRLGLRRMELFKLEPKNICLDSKTIHITGNRKGREKSPRGNRLLPYDQLLKPDEVTLLEHWTNNRSLSQDGSYFLFNNQIEKHSEKVVVNKVSRFLTGVLRSIAKNQNLTIKSLRKTFASEVFINIAMYQDYSPLMKFIQINKINAAAGVDQSLNLERPHNVYWLLATWMGHSTPQTTFEYYVLTQELALFLSFERMPQEDSQYTQVLKSLNVNKSVNEATFKNLNRFKNHKYASLFSSKIANLPSESFVPGEAIYSDLFAVDLQNEALQKILVLHADDFEDKQIDSRLYLDSGTTTLIVGAAKRLLTPAKGRSIPDILLKSMIKKLAWFEFDRSDNEFRTKRISQLTKKMLANSEKLEESELGKLKSIWQKQLVRSNKKPGEFVITNVEDLQCFLQLYDKFQMHDDFGGCLIVEIEGFKFEEDAPILGGPYYLNVVDKRTVSVDEFPEEEFVLKLSYRAGQAKKLATCQLGLNSILFWRLFNKRV